MVLNGWELGGGSVRIHRAEVQARCSARSKIGAEEARSEVRLPARRAAVRRAAARRHRLRPGPHGHADGRRRVDPRRDRLPEDAARAGPADAARRARSTRSSCASWHMRLREPAASREAALAAVALAFCGRVRWRVPSEMPLDELPHRSAGRRSRSSRQAAHFRTRRTGAYSATAKASCPSATRGYYREYTVRTPGVKDRGARRIVAGGGGEYYYSDDHYRTFRRIIE